MTIQSIFISGPMSGYANFNYEAFNQAAEALRAAGYTVHNPAEFFDGDQSLSWHEYMREDIRTLLEETDAVVALEGWHDSKGANVEITVARALGIPVWDIQNFAIVENNEKDPYAAVPDHPEVKAPVNNAWRWNNTSSNTSGSWGFSPFTTSSYNLIPTQRESPEEVATDTILEEAAKAVDGPREQVYDHPAVNFQRIADLWSTYLGVPITPQQHAVMMILVKVARLMKSPEHRDTLVDIAGYARTIEKITEHYTE